MSFITQYILQKGISEDIFILVFAIPIIFVIILFARRMLGLRTFGLYTPLVLVILLAVIGVKCGAILFAIIFIPMIIIRYFLRKITFLSLVDTRMLDALTFCVLILIIVLAFLYIPFFNKISLNIVILLAMLLMSSYSESLISNWEIRGFKRFIAPAVESLGLITASYFLVAWPFTQNIILNYPLGVILVSIIIILLLARWRRLKLREYIEFKEVIKHVELPEKK